MHKITRLAALSAMAIAAGTIAVPAQAQTVSLTGTVVNLCVLTLSTPGVLGISSTGLDLATSQTGGVAASLSVVATGSNPTVTFSTPTLTGPSSSGATTELAYTSVGGATRSMSSAGYVYAMTRLIDTVTVNGHASNPSGFRSGIYTISATATCSQ